MQVKRENILPSAGSSFRLLLTPRLNDYFYWHFHPEYEIVYVEGAHGTRHIGEHISAYEGSDLVFIGPNIPHLNFDYGVTTDCRQVIIQMKQDFLGEGFFQVPEMEAVRQLFERSHYGLSFSGTTKQQVGEVLKTLASLEHFERLLALLQIFQLLATSSEVTQLNARPAGNKLFGKGLQRMRTVYTYVEAHYLAKPDVHEVAQQVHLSTAAFCRFFKKQTNMTFTDFVNQYRMNEARNLLLQDKSISEACFAVGFDSLSYFNKLFRKTTGENPSDFKKRYLK